MGVAQLGSPLFTLSQEVRTYVYMYIYVDGTGMFMPIDEMVTRRHMLRKKVIACMN